MATDPITKTYDAIWTMLEASSDFTTAVLSPNRVKFNTRMKCITKPRLLTKDTPQVIVLPLGIHTVPEVASNASQMKYLWSIEMIPGDKQHTTWGNLEFIIWAALHKWRTYLRQALQHNSKTYVTELRTLKMTDDLRNLRDQRLGAVSQFPESWICVWTGYTDMHYDSGDYLS